MSVVLISLGVIFLICSLGCIACYYLYKRDTLRVGVKWIDKVLKKDEQNPKCVQVGRTLYCNNDFYDVINNLSIVSKYDLFTDNPCDMRICVVPDDYFESYDAK